MRQALANDIALVIRITKRARGLAPKGAVALQECTPAKRQLVRQMREERGGGKNVVTPDGRSKGKRKRRRAKRSGHGEQERRHESPLCREIFIHDCNYHIVLFFSRLQPTTTPLAVDGGLVPGAEGGGVEKRSEQKRVKLV